MFFIYSDLYKHLIYVITRIQIHVENDNHNNFMNAKM